MAEGNPAPIVAANLTNYRAVSLGPDQAWLDRQMNRLTDSMEYTQAASPMHTLWCVQGGTDCLSHDQLLIQFHLNMEQMPGPET